MEITIKATIPDGKFCELPNDLHCPFFSREMQNNSCRDFVFCHLFNDPIYDEGRVEKCEQCLKSPTEVIVGLR